MDNSKLGIGVAIALVGALTIMFGATGFRAAIAFALLYCLPAYYLLSAFLEEDEALILSVFLSIGVVPSVAYGVGFYSLKLGIAAGAAALLLAGYVVRRAMHRDNTA